MCPPFKLWNKMILFQTAKIFVHEHWYYIPLIFSSWGSRFWLWNRTAFAELPPAVSCRDVVRRLLYVLYSPHPVSLWAQYSVAFRAKPVSDLGLRRHTPTGEESTANEWPNLKIEKKTLLIPWMLFDSVFMRLFHSVISSHLYFVYKLDMCSLWASLFKYCSRFCLGKHVI